MSNKELLEKIYFEEELNKINADTLYYKVYILYKEYIKNTSNSSIEKIESLINLFFDELPISILFKMYYDNQWLFKNSIISFNKTIIKDKEKLNMYLAFINFHQLFYDEVSMFNCSYNITCEKIEALEKTIYDQKIEIDVLRNEIEALKQGKCYG